jgi:peptidoglycan-associated lipoprotein
MYNWFTFFSGYLCRKEIAMVQKRAAFLLLTCMGLMVSACAKDQVVKPDESIAASGAGSMGKAPAGAVPPQQQTRAAAEPAATAPTPPGLPSQPLPSQQVQSESTLALNRPAPSTATTSTLGNGFAISAETAQQTLKRINFDFDSYVLTQTARDILYQDAEILLKKYKGQVQLEGHCDERGSDEYNLALGENRAKAALRYLVTLGVPENQLSIISYGKERPIDPDHTEEAWAKNRRVDFTVVK